MLEQQEATAAWFASLLAQRDRKRANELGLRVLASALSAAVIVAVDIWQKDDGKDDLLALVDRAFTELAERLQDLEPSRGGRRSARKAPAKRGRQDPNVRPRD